MFHFVPSEFYHGALERGEEGGEEERTTGVEDGIPTFYYLFPDA